MLGEGPVGAEAKPLPSKLSLTRPTEILDEYECIETVVYVGKSFQ